MGKRKSARKPGAGKTKMAPLDKSFKCLFCQHTGTVTCKIDSKKQSGRLDCKDCGQHFTCDTNHLTEAIDIYSEWIDACKDVNPDDVSDHGGRSPSPEVPRGGTGRLQKRRAAEDAEDDEEDLPDYRRKKGAQEDAEEEDEEEDLPEPKRRKQGRVEDDEDDDE